MEKTEKNGKDNIEELSISSPDKGSLREVNKQTKNSPEKTSKCTKALEITDEIAPLVENRRSRDDNKKDNETEIESGLHNVTSQPESADTVQTEEELQLVNICAAAETVKLIKNEAEVHNEDIDQTDSLQTLSESTENPPNEIESNNGFTKCTDNEEVVSIPARIPVKLDLESNGIINQEKIIENINSRNVAQQAEPEETLHESAELLTCKQITVAQPAETPPKLTDVGSNDEAIDSTNDKEIKNTIIKLMEKRRNIIKVEAIVHREDISENLEQEVNQQQGQGEQILHPSHGVINRQVSVLFSQSENGKVATETCKGNYDQDKEKIRIEENDQLSNLTDQSDKLTKEKCHPITTVAQTACDENGQLPASEEEFTEQSKIVLSTQGDISNATNIQKNLGDENQNSIEEESILSPSKQQNSDIPKNWMSVAIKQEPPSDVDDEFNDDHEETAELSAVIPRTDDSFTKEKKKTKTKSERGKKGRKVSEKTKVDVITAKDAENSKRKFDVVIKQEMIDVELESQLIPTDKIPDDKDDDEEATSNQLPTSSTTVPGQYATTDVKKPENSDKNTNRRESLKRNKNKNVSVKLKKTTAGVNKIIKKEVTDQSQSTRVLISETRKKDNAQEEKVEMRVLRSRTSLPETCRIKEEPVIEAEQNELRLRQKKSSKNKKRISKLSIPPSDRIMRSAAGYDTKFHPNAKNKGPFMQRSEIPNTKTEPESEKLMLKHTHENISQIHNKEARKQSNIAYTEETKTNGLKTAKHDGKRVQRTVSKKVKYMPKKNQSYNKARVTRSEMHRNKPSVNTDSGKLETGRKNKSENRNGNRPAGVKQIDAENSERKKTEKKEQSVTSPKTRRETRMTRQRNKDNSSPARKDLGNLKSSGVVKKSHSAAKFGTGCDERRRTRSQEASRSQEETEKGKEKRERTCKKDSCDKQQAAIEETGLRARKHEDDTIKCTMNVGELNTWTESLVIGVIIHESAVPIKIPEKRVLSGDEDKDSCGQPVPEVNNLTTTSVLFVILCRYINFVFYLFNAILGMN